MHNVGDKFEVVSGGDGFGLKDGDILTLHEEINSYGARFKTELGKLIVGGYEGKTTVNPTVRPLRTEAEKRGAKFGVTGVVKGTKIKISFVSDAIEKNALGEILWCVCYEDGITGYHHPSNIRLDHEPEYKEIPFSEASHEQRMDENNLWYRGTPVVQISHFVGSGYAFTYNGSPDIHTDTTNLTIRIPA